MFWSLSRGGIDDRLTLHVEARVQHHFVIGHFADGLHQRVLLVDRLHAG
jgi:hypothetical protein